MDQKYHYATVTEAIEQLHGQGYTLYFILKNSMLEASDQTYQAEDFEITDLYRYEGPSDPADEAVVYALSSKSGVKGLLVAGYGPSSDRESEEVLKKMHYKYHQSRP